MADNFKDFAQAVKTRFEQMSKGELYEVNVERDEVFELYLKSFPEGTNPIFRVRTEHDGSYDRAFVRNVGHVVTIDTDGTLKTIWDISGLAYPYDVVAKALGDMVRARDIVSVFRTKENVYGHLPNNELIDGKTYRFNHFIVGVDSRHKSSTPDADRGAINTAFAVFKRGLEELTMTALDDVTDMIKSNTLYRGQEHAQAVAGFVKTKRAYDTAQNKNAFVWANLAHSAAGGSRVNPTALFRNSVIGTLVVDLSAGEDIEKAVRSFESKVAPANYKRPTAIVTPAMIEKAVSDLRGAGLEEAIERRYAKLDDVSINNVLWADGSAASRMKDGLTSMLMASAKIELPDPKGAMEISAEEFLQNVVPNARSMDIYLENQHLSNFVSITAPVHANAGKLFKWDNGFAWSYDGDVTDSVKERVKRAGGRTDAKLRISLAWFNQDDLDLHVMLPDGDVVYYGNKRGLLDVDMNVTNPVRDAVENVSFTSAPKDGWYGVAVHNFTQRETVEVGFTIEIESEGVITQYDYEDRVYTSKPVRAMAILVKNGVIAQIDLNPKMKTASRTTDKWGVKTRTLIPVDTLMLSPNHWDGQKIGNKHWFFILKDCVNPDSARGIYNEFLRADLEKHRKVFELLGSKMKCAPSAEQLSGVGFSSTRHDEVVVIVRGDRASKAYRIKF